MRFTMKKATADSARAATMRGARIIAAAALRITLFHQKEFLPQAFEISSTKVRAKSLRRMMVSTATTNTRNIVPSATNVVGNEKSAVASNDLEGTCIVGAGLAGLATAAALRNIVGIESVCVLERASRSEFERDTAGAAVQLGPNGLRALRAIGGQELVDKIYSNGTCLKGNAIILPGGKTMVMPDQTKADCGLPQVLIRWALLRSILLDLLPSKSIVTSAGSETVGYSIHQRYGNKKEFVELDPADSRVNPAPLLVAADGIHSTFQSLIHSGDSAIPHEDVENMKRANIIDGGRVNIKAVAPTDLGPDFEPGTTYSFFAPDGTACFAGPAGKGYTYWAISIADEKGENGEVTPFLCTEVRDLEMVKTKLLTKLRDLEATECQFAIDLIEQSKPSTIFVARSEEREHVGPSLVSQDGLVVLVGDAAHAMSPAYGQAANFAFEDGATLATCIKNNPNSLNAALKEYSDSRVSRCVEMQRLSVERTKKATRGEKTEDISKWIFAWDI